MKSLVLLLTGSLLCCAAPARLDIGPVRVVPSAYEPAAQLGDAGRGSAVEGTVIGAAGGAGIGAMSAKASAGLLCTVGGPLCWIVMIPAAVVGGVVGGLAGGVADAVTSTPGEGLIAARSAIDQAVAQMRLTNALAARLPSAASPYTLEIEVTDLQYLQREKDLALALRARARLYRGGDLLEERCAEARTDYRRYEDWAADQARPLRQAVDGAIAQLGNRLGYRVN
mgnify:CR=1 FL=1